MATTAAVLNAYRKELLDGGMPPDVVDNLVRDAAHLDVESRGLRVQFDATSAPTADRMRLRDLGPDH
jgi:hypothetical protein